MAIKQAIFMPISDNILACFQDDAIHIWGFPSFQCVKQVVPDTWKGDSIRSLAFTRNGRAMVLGGASRQLVIFTVDDWDCQRVILLPDYVSKVEHLEFLPQAFDSGANQILVVLLDSGKLLFLDLTKETIMESKTENNIKHVLCIGRIFQQPQGHLLLIGVSGAGKTTLSRFVAWMNGLSIFQIKVHNKYTGEDFDEDLRAVLRRSGCEKEKIAFIIDESNVLDSGFLERMNNLLTNGEVPGLFTGSEYDDLMNLCEVGARKEGRTFESNEDLFKWFTGQVMLNLHVVFTMNTSSESLKEHAATSPALSNRCVINWLGDWSEQTMFQVGKELTNTVDLDRPSWKAPDSFPSVHTGLPAQPSHREAVINACVYVHQTLHKANASLAKRGSRAMTITPRHYLDFIHHFVKLYTEKRSYFEEQQLRLNVGLDKIAETVLHVEELQKSSKVISQELAAMNEAANAKLEQMEKDRQEAEKKKVESQDIQADIERQTVDISEKRDAVKMKLAQVEPAVIDAKQAVKNINNKELDEVRSFNNPSALVAMVLESICVLLGENATNWNAVRTFVRRRDFKSIVSNFKTEDIADAVRQKMHETYLSRPDYNFEKIRNANRACGKLVKWAIAQVQYADMLQKLKPLQDELGSLEQQASKNENKAEDLKKQIAQLEQSVESSINEHNQLTSQAKALQTDLKNVQAKVDRSTQLLESLVFERKRWQASRETFRSQMSTIIGDVLLSSAFLAYAGYFDQHYRQNLFAKWCHHLKQAGLKFRTDIAMTEYLSKPGVRLRWQANSLPTDKLCTENAIMLKRLQRFPLIIDPSGQASEFIMKEYKKDKISKTSFLDDSFRAELKSALRFGYPLLVQDVENYDPILNPVLDREWRRTGGRDLITLGDENIDWSPSFKIFLSTRDPTVEFPPELCSRVTFVNFTVTRSSLQSQCLDQVLKAERPDIDKKRSDLLKLQGEFHVRQRRLQDDLLQTLSEATGNILDDDSMITTLVTLRQEAAEISQKEEETGTVIAEIEIVARQYSQLCQACSNIYSTMDSLKRIHFLYQYSLQFFQDIFSSVLHSNPRLQNVTDYNQRLAVVTKDLFGVCYERVARGMLHTDRLTFAILLCRIHLKGVPNEASLDSEFTFFLRGKEGMLNSSPPAIEGLNQEQIEAVVRLSSRINAYKHLSKKIKDSPEFPGWLQHSSPEQCVPALWEEDKQLSAVAVAMHNLLLIQAFRPDRVIAAGQALVAAVLGEEFMAAADRELDLATIVNAELRANVPALLCSVPGYDASGRVDDLVAKLRKQIVAIAIGSAEGFNQADRAINQAVRSGRWVLLKNVHLAPQWLVQLEKKLHSLQPHPGFRLFLTMEMNPKVPVNLLRAGRIFVFEPPPGIKANLLRTFSTVPAARIKKAPLLYFLLAWFHAIVQERLRYVPLGWAKYYEFNESDLRVACDTLDTWIEATAMGRTNLPPKEVPWDALVTLLSKCIYGGKIDNDFDQRLLKSLLAKLFTPASLKGDFALVANVDGVGGPGGQRHITMPDGTTRDHFLHWIEALSDRQTPSWLGLPNNAEKVLLTTRGTDLVGKLLKMQQLEDDDELAYSSEEGLDLTRESVDEVVRFLEQQVATLRPIVKNPTKDPLYCYFEREVNSAADLVHNVVHDFQDALLIYQGVKKQTDYHRTMMNDLENDIVPASWRRYPVPDGCTVIQWLVDLYSRVQQRHWVSQLMSEGVKKIKTHPVWLGGLLNPEAYLTATRQCVAQANSGAQAAGRKLQEQSAAAGHHHHDRLAHHAAALGARGARHRGALLKAVPARVPQLDAHGAAVHGGPQYCPRPGPAQLLRAGRRPAHFQLIWFG
ncbi:dynein heavy chain, cytoplasmic-like isoform X2 [Thrips palmi]|uniref:Dynein heavy chain, cytoplasmic-like isoform X2 n=1 Tax=Thrips palmi TaxID=161013 RepID=A0A6P8ZCP2_THRPL|nr:dynein heavy chain, cytoplasmic-like isoform X2 [Thrips palmi]